jgi:hypothetical protein
VTLPWAGRRLQVKETGAWEAILSGVQTYVNGNARTKIPKMMCVFDNDEPASDNYLGWVLESVETVSANDWDTSACIKSVRGSHGKKKKKRKYLNLPFFYY